MTVFHKFNQYTKQKHLILKYNQKQIHKNDYKKI